MALGRWLLLASLVGLPMGAQACEYGYCWGALGFGPDGVSGQSVRQNTVPDAEAELRRACGDKCTVIEMFNDTCASLVENEDGVGFFGTGEDEFAATEDATATCQSISQYCVRRVSACSKQ